MNEKEEIKLGTDEEHEHDAVFKAVAADSKAGKLKPLSFYTKMLAGEHVAKIKDYYTRLATMEHEAKESKKDERKEDEGLHDKEVDGAFSKWTSLSDKMDTSECKPASEYFPSVSLKIPGKWDFKVGDEMEVEFKACVESIEKTKDGTRIRLELKEAKF